MDNIQQPPLHICIVVVARIYLFYIFAIYVWQLYNRYSHISVVAAVTWFTILIFCTIEPAYNTAIVEMPFILVGYY